MFERHQELLGDCLERITNSKILIAGVGGLGSTVSELAVRTGFKEIYLVDYKEVDDPDLNRQILYTKDDVDKHKLDAAEERLKRISDVNIIKIKEKINEDFEIPNVDIVVDCLDNFKTRYILEEKSFEKRLPFIHGGVKGYAGQVTVLYPHKTKRLKEIFGNIEDDLKPPQVFPPVVTLVGSIQLSEAVKIICGDEDGSLMNRLLVIDLSTSTFDVIYLS